mgnify:CR=1 FL=1
MNLIDNYGIKAYDDNDDVIDDKELMNYYDDCFVLDDLFEQSSFESRNEFELSLYSDAEGFVTVNGGNCILASIFGKPVVVYACEGKELRPNYFNDNCYFKQFANASLYPIIDPAADINRDGTRKYNEVLDTIEQVFK